MCFWMKCKSYHIGKETSPEDIFDYIYGVLHSPAYRTKYKEFLKVDFPRIPYPKDQTEFEHFRSFGYQLRELHLMHNVPDSPVSFPNAGSMQVDYLRWVWNKDTAIRAIYGSTRHNVLRAFRQRRGSSISAATNPRRNGSKTAKVAHSPLTI